MKIFISYASEDALIAAAVESAFSKLNSDGYVNITVYRDVHTFQQGRPIKSQILEELRDSKILFVVYSKTLKRSHSYTGFEIGAFSAMIDEDARANRKSGRRIVSLYLDDVPPSEQDVLGIKLNVESLRPGREQTAKSLGLSGDFTKFLNEISDEIIENQFPEKMDDESIEHYVDRKGKAKLSAKSKIKKRLIPQLDKELRVALSSMIARFTIEQRFLQFRWEPRKDQPITELDNDVMLSADKPDILKLFGLSDISSSTTWGEVKDYAKENNFESGQYAINAIEYVVASALSVAPVDNDQIVMASDGALFRVIVTRHYAYFDGGRTMHIYFIPMIVEKVTGPAFRALALLRLATRFRTMFLMKGAPLSDEAFQLHQKDPKSFKLKVDQFERETLFTAGQSHNHGLDNPQNFVEFFGEEERPNNQDIATLYSNWKIETEKILSLARSVDNASDFSTFVKKWNASLKEYIDFVAPINQRIGIQSAERLVDWFERQT